MDIKRAWWTYKTGLYEFKHHIYLFSFLFSVFFKHCFSLPFLHHHYWQDFSLGEYFLLKPFHTDLSFKQGDVSRTQQRTCKLPIFSPKRMKSRSLKERPLINTTIYQIIISSLLWWWAFKCILKAKFQCIVIHSFHINIFPYTFWLRILYSPDVIDHFVLVNLLWYAINMVL